MLNTAILANDNTLCEALEQTAEACGIFRLVIRLAPLPSVQEVLKMLRTQTPEVILLDVSDWEAVSLLASKIKEAQLKTIVVGISDCWTQAEQLEFQAAGIEDILLAPFSPDQLEARIYDALHRTTPVLHPNLLAFLPAKAGGGASTVALTTALALSKGRDEEPKKVLLIEADRRSGVLSILLNLKDQPGLASALQAAGEMTPLEWSRSIVPLGNVHLLLANPKRRGALHTWADYYQLLKFANRDRYDYIVVDLPEIINDATRELVRAARATFITCTPELPSLAMASLRSADLASAQIPSDKVKILVNRFERAGFSLEHIEVVLGQPVFATLPNDYREIRKAIMEARCAAPSSAFARGCDLLAEKINQLDQPAPTPSRFSLLRKLSLLAS